MRNDLTKDYYSRIDVTVPNICLECNEVPAWHCTPIQLYIKCHWPDPSTSTCDNSKICINILKTWRRSPMMKLEEATTTTWQLISTNKRKNMEDLLPDLVWEVRRQMSHFAASRARVVFHSVYNNSINTSSNFNFHFHTFLINLIT